MHSIRLEIEDSVFEKVIYFLQHLPENEVKIVEETDAIYPKNTKPDSDVKAYSNHSANLIEEWKESEEERWKNQLYMSAIQHCRDLLF